MNERDEIAVTDTGNHRVQVFSSDGINTYDPSPVPVKPRQFCPVLSFGQRGSSA